MPIYAFACEQCGKRFDQLVSYDRRHEVVCPDCGAATQVLLSTFAVKGGSPSARPAASPFS